MCVVSCVSCLKLVDAAGPGREAIMLGVFFDVTCWGWMVFECGTTNNNNNNMSLFTEVPYLALLPRQSRGPTTPTTTATATTTTAAIVERGNRTMHIIR